ncbi:hypothetical protein Tcan_07914 [Toxocara canis]|uniref:Uncharacterized protein n=1 Tax=Toxocara canis TaxID=6265 RepID=A0A0B2VMB7_TOXCA|nr:hypothetical protein Tcan_07914 [Toxocara canis]
MFRYMKYGVPVADSCSRPATPTVEARPQHRGLWGAFRRKWQMRSNERERSGAGSVRLTNTNASSSFLARPHSVRAREKVMSRSEPQVLFTSTGRRSSPHSPTSVNVIIVPP